MPERDAPETPDDGDVDGDGSPFPALLKRLASAPARDPGRDLGGGGPERNLGRFELMRRIGRGGFGVVYQARDTVLGRHVAVKIMRRRAAGRWLSPELDKLFKVEAEIAARLNHPNIVTLHDFGSIDGRPYLVLELLIGETLQARLARGPLPAIEAVHISAEIAEGLAHAHGVGVVHGDLKPSNVFLTADGRVKLLDFGLARVQAAFEPVAPSAGTPGYMAPEQWRDEPADTRTDVHSAGLVLHEMLTGALPPDEVPILAGVPRPLADILARALARDANERIQTGHALREDLRAVERSLAVARSGARSRWMWAIAALAASASAVGALVARPPRPAAEDTGARGRRSVAVLGFRNLSARPDKAWISPALSTMLTSELAAGDELRTIPGESVARMKLDLGLPEADGFTGDTLRRVRQNVDADFVLAGSYLALGDGRLRLDLRLQDAIAGRTVLLVSEAGSEAEIFELTVRAGAGLRQKMGVAPATPSASAIVRGSMPHSPDAARLYAVGIGALWRGDSLAARATLEQAVTLEPDHALLHAALAHALGDLDYEEQAQHELERAYQLSSSLPREGQLLVEGQYHVARREFSSAVDSYRTLVEYYPDSLDYGLRLANAQLADSRTQDAFATVSRLRKLPLPAGDDPGIDMAEFSAHAQANDSPAMRATADRMASIAEARGARGLVAEAKRRQAFVAMLEGDLARAAALSEEAERIFVALGYQSGAIAMQRRLIEIAQLRGDLTAALGALEEMEAKLRERGSKFHLSDVLLKEATYTLQRGDLERADRLAAEAFALSPFMVGRSETVEYGVPATSIRAERGDISGARRMAENAMAVLTEVAPNDPTHAAAAKAALTNLLRMQGDLAAARRNGEELLHLWVEQAPSPLRAAEIRVALADVALAEGRATEAETQSRAAAAEYARAGVVDSEAAARVRLARALAAEGRLAEAESALAPAIARAAVTERVAVAIQVTAAAASLRAAGGDPRTALAMLQDAAATAARVGFVPEKLEIELVRGQTELLADRSAGRARLAALASEAAAKGFGLLARDAARALH